MKKKLFSLAFIALASCSDMAPSVSEVVSEELPVGFDVKDYVEINPDVKISQIAMDIKIKNATSAFGSSQRLEACRTFLSDVDLAEDIYLNYLSCPRKGWNPNLSCDDEENKDAFNGFTVNNVAYNKENACKIKGCWASGWDEPYCPDITLAECQDEMGDEHYCCLLVGRDEIKPLKINMGRAQEYNPGKQNPLSIDTVFTHICTFNLLPSDGVFELNENKAYIDNFKYDDILIEKHFLMAGRYEGRAYRYCNNDFDSKDVRREDMATYIRIRPYNRNNEYFYDYSMNPKTNQPQFFCLNKVDGKVYRIK